MNRHSKAVRTAPTDARGSRRVASLTLVSLAALLALVFASSASALTQRPFKEVFGSAAQPSISGQTLTVELSSGDVLVATGGFGGGLEGKITRFHADGTPAPFPGLGTNVIDGKEENGKPCSEEPASCDKTPRGGLEIRGKSQIAIDESGGITDGDIYVTESYDESWVDIFAPDGTYLGQLGGYHEQEFELFNPAAGVAVDQTGAVFIGTSQEVYKFVPTADPVVEADGVSSFSPPVATYEALGDMTLGTGPTAGSLFVLGNHFGGSQFGETSVFQFDSATGALDRVFAGGQVGGRPHIDVDPKTGTVLFTSTDRSISEYEAALTSEPKKLGRVLIGDELLQAFALNGESDVVVEEFNFSDQTSRFSVYGTPATVPSVTVEPASGVSGTRALLSGTVNPSNLPLTGCFFEYGETESEGSFPNTASCEGALPPTDSSPHRVQADISGLEPNGHTYSFRLVATNANGREESPLEKFTTLNTVVTKPASPISTTGATLNGIVRPEGEKYSDCFFEYGINTSPGFERRVPCVPGASDLPQNFSPQSVSAPLSGLKLATTYRYRLVASTPGLGTLEGEELTFTTQGAPRITDVRALDADQGSATLEGKINPSGFGASYRFEWGPTASYGHRAPAEFEPFIGNGEAPVRVSVQISGLSAGTAYHYRLVASSTAGIVASADRTLETLNGCGLPEGRCFELVSRAEAGPIAIPGLPQLGAELWYQVDPGGGGVTYPVESGYPDARRGAEVLYRASHGSDGWHSTELSPPFVAPNERNETGSETGYVQWISDDLSCAFLQSSQPLTADASARQVIEAGGLNYYRRNPDDSYTAVTKLAPENIDAASGGLEYSFNGASQDCHKVIFTTEYRYPGVPVANPNAQYHTYEWNEGALQELEGSFSEDKENVVSEDGSRVFFANGTLFENGSVTREYAASETATPPTEVAYQWATRDGSKVFFTAHAGLSADASGEGEPEGTDLYEYDLETEELTDRTVVQAKGGARVAGFLGSSADGSVVYFGSPAQLLPGRGPTFNQNQKANTNSIYREAGGALTYVGTADPTPESTGLYVKRSQAWTSQVSADGRYLLFQSAANLTGYESGGAVEAYLFDAEGGSGSTTTCISCRQDGLPSLAPAGYQVLPVGGRVGNFFHRPQFLVVREGRPEVFFSSVDALAPGAVAGQNNIYEWVHDQVFRLTSAPAGTQEVIAEGLNAVFAGASADGADVYLSSPENLSWEDQDRRNSIFDARIGGGSPQPAPPPAPCAASVEDSCQGAAQGGPAVPGAASATFNGPGNPKQTQPRKKKKQQKAHKKKSKKHAKKSHGKKARHANGNRRAGK